MIVANAAPLPVPPVLTVLEGGRDEEPIAPRELVELEGAWIEVQAIAHEAEMFADIAIDVARRIQVAIATGRPAIAGQYAHGLEMAAPRYAYRARASELEAQRAIERIHPEPVA